VVRGGREEIEGRCVGSWGREEDVGAAGGWSALNACAHCWCMLA
jgi:hypothetical protein